MARDMIVRVKFVIEDIDVVDKIRKDEREKVTHELLHDSAWKRGCQRCDDEMASNNMRWESP